MLDRYSKKEMKGVWSEINKFYYWILVEVAVLKARRILGEIPHTVSSGLTEGIIINPEEINRIEKETTGQDVIAFLMHVSPQFPENLRPWLHRGLTSYDIVDTALSIQMRESIKFLLYGISGLMCVIQKVAIKYKYVPEMGRTHGIHADLLAPSAIVSTSPRQ